jgi:hypothetical protein
VDGKSKSTRNKIQWAQAAFRRWSPLDLKTLDMEAINSIVPKYILEIQKEDGGNYPPNMLYNLVIYLQQGINELHQNSFNFLEDEQFKPIRLGLNAELK